MRTLHKKQAEYSIKLMNQAHSEIRKALETKKFDLVQELLRQSQDMAIELNRMIAAEEGANCPVVAILKDYCELLYRIFDSVRQRQPVNGGKTCKSLQRMALMIEKSMKDDIRIYTEAVFLPWDVSMWASLENLWKAADDDIDCDAYVVPVTHSDGYPDYTPVISYQDYDFAERQPDLIFMHNPSDGCNYVIGVHPFPCSLNLDQFTEKLIYIPSPVPAGGKGAGRAKSRARFASCPGAVYGERLELPSEEMRRFYTDVLTRSAGGNAGKIWENIVVSPDF